MSARTSRVILLVVLVAIAAFLLYVVPAPSSTSVQNPVSSPKQSATVQILFPNALVQAEIARTAVALTLGLGNRASLSPGTGMWFEFGRENRWGIWMKDMRFAIDIIWFDKNLSVVSLAQKISPATYPKVFYPSREAMYVLEVPSGFVENFRVTVGETVFLR